MLLRDAIDGGGRNLDHALKLELSRRSKDVAAAVDLGRADIFLGIERKGGGAMDHGVAAFGHFLDRRHIAHVAKSELQPRGVLFGIVEGRDIKNAYFVYALFAQETD